MSTVAVQLVWDLSRLDQRIIAAIGKELESWVGTPWQHGQQVKGPKGGADCARFVTGFTDRMRGDAYWKYRVLPLDVAANAPAISFRLMREIMAHYQHIEINTPVVEPGDTLWTGPINGGPGHGQIIGQKQGLLYHCDRPTGVVRVGCTYDPEVQSKFRIFRPLGKEDWGR